MKKKSFKIVLVSSILSLGLLYVYFIYNPIIIQNNFAPDEVCFPVYCNKGEKILLLNNFNFEKGDWKACVIIHERIDLSSDIPYGKYLLTHDKELLNKLGELTFEYTGSDLATVENEIILYKDDLIVFRCKIVIDKNLEGFQSSKFGWIEVKKGELSNIIKSFEHNYFPFVFI